MAIGQTPAVEIETRLKNDQALQKIAELKNAMSSGFKEAAGDAKSSLAGLGKNVGTEFAGMVTAVGLATVAFGVLRAGISSFVDFMSESIKAASEAEEAELKLTRVLQLRGEYTEENKNALLAFNSALEAQSTLDADQLLQVQGTLSAMGVLQEDLQDVTLAVIGFSEKYGKDLPEAATLVGKAVVENIDVLAKFGIHAKDATDLVNQLAPAASLASDRLELLSGKLTAQNTAWGNFSEAVGSTITKSEFINGTLKSLTETTRGLGRSFADAQPYISAYIDLFGKVATAASPPILAFQLLRDALRDDVESSPILDTSTGRVKTPNAKDKLGGVLVTEPFNSADETRAQAERSKRITDLQREQAAVSKKIEEDHNAANKKLMSDRSMRIGEMFGVELDAAANYAKLSKEQERLKSEEFNIAREFFDLENKQHEARKAIEDLRLRETEIRYQGEENALRHHVEEMDAGYDRIQQRIEEDAAQKNAWLEQGAAFGSQVLASVTTDLWSAALEGDKVNWGGLFGGLLSTIGQTAIALGGIAIAAGALGTAVPLFAGLAGPQAIGLGAGLIVAGSLAVAAGAKLGSGGSASASASASAGSAGGFRPAGGSGSTGFAGTPRGFQPPGSVTEPRATVINVSFSGLMAGSERGLGREIGRVLKAGGTLVPGGR